MLARNVAITCCFRVSRVGGMFSIDGPPHIKSIHQILFMSSILVVVYTVKNDEELFNELVLAFYFYFCRCCNIA